MNAIDVLRSYIETPQEVTWHVDEAEPELGAQPVIGNRDPAVGLAALADLEALVQERDLFADCVVGVAEIWHAVESGDLTRDEGWDAFTAHLKEQDERALARVKGEHLTDIDTLERTVLEVLPRVADPSHDALRELVARLKQAEAVIEAARALYEAPCGTFPAAGTNAPCGDLVLALGDALRALDGEAKPCPHENQHFDRSLCACGSMHTYCDNCGQVLGADCPTDGET